LVAISAVEYVEWIASNAPQFLQRTGFALKVMPPGLRVFLFLATRCLWHIVLDGTASETHAPALTTRPPIKGASIFKHP
jgi:hypothetical protein